MFRKSAFWKIFGRKTIFFSFFSLTFQTLVALKFFPNFLFVQHANLMIFSVTKFTMHKLFRVLVVVFLFLKKVLFNRISLSRASNRIFRCSLHRLLKVFYIFIFNISTFLLKFCSIDSAIVYNQDIKIYQFNLHSYAARDVFERTKTLFLIGS